MAFFISGLMDEAKVYGITNFCPRFGFHKLILTLFRFRRLLNLVLVITLELLLELLLLERVAHGEAIVLQPVLRLDLLLV